MLLRSRLHMPSRHDQELSEAAIRTVEEVYDAAKQFSQAVQAKGLLYALALRLLIFPLAGFGIGYFLFNYKLGIVLAVSFVWYEAVAALAAIAVLLGIPIAIIFGAFYIYFWITK